MPQTASPFNTGLAAWQWHAHEFPSHGTLEQQYRHLVGYAILAPSPYNSQPWRFELGQGTITLLGDAPQRLRAIDTYQSDYHLALGCALENLLIAAEHFEFAHEVEYFPDFSDPEKIASIRLMPGLKPNTDHRSGLMFDAMTERRTERAGFLSHPVPTEVQLRLLACSDTPRIRIQLVDDPGMVHWLHEQINAADAHLAENTRLREELHHLALQARRSAAGWVSKLERMATHMLRRDVVYEPAPAAQPTSPAPMIGIIGCDVSDPIARVHTGQVFERVFLLATALGLGLQPVNCVLHVAPTRAALLAQPWIDDLGNPLIVFKLGYSAGAKVHTPRRPLDDVVID